MPDDNLSCVNAWSKLEPATRCALVTAMIWVVGWSIAIPIYWYAPIEEADPLADYTHSKRYLDGVERVGGKAAIFGNEVSDGFVSLWHGARLGVTLGILTLIVALFYFVRTSRRIARESEPHVR